ncbi:MAG: MFS transporter [Planctomycetes bacterium]|nr:MFS transporter [Planctomycetota bacterium]
MAILAAGVGFGIRGGILGNWTSEFGFTGAELGAIGGAGFTGFCFGIILTGIIVDKVGYGTMTAAAFILHVASAVITLGATKGQDPHLAYNLLYWGTFVFALANGVLEGVANPLVATLFPQNRTHYLNILHASWPAGMVIGGLIGWTLGDAWSWKAQLALFLVPTVLYGVLFLGQRFPRSEAAVKGLGIGEMFKDVGLLGAAVASYLLALFSLGICRDSFGLEDGAAQTISYGIGALLVLLVGFATRFSLGAFLLFVLFIAHALVGAVELGTDTWIQNITGNILTSKEGKLLFVITSLLMFGLRFCAHFIEKTLRLSPVGLLLVCSVIAAIGLNLVSNADTFTMALIAVSVYALGKAFFWPTMLAIVGDRFPRTGAIAMSIMGGIGMMSAGLIGSVGLGYAKDRFAGEALATVDFVAYGTYQADKMSSFLFFEPVRGIDGATLKALQERPATERTDVEQTVVEASIAGDRKTLTVDSYIPAAMAVIFLVMLLYFRAVGGYKPVQLLQDPINNNITTKM